MYRSVNSKCDLIRGNLHNIMQLEAETTTKLGDTEKLAFALFTRSSFCQEMAKFYQKFPNVKAEKTCQKTALISVMSYSEDGSMGNFRHP